MKIRVISLVAMTAAITLQAAERRVLNGQVPKAVARVQTGAPLPTAQPLELALTLPLRNREALTTLLQQLYDPASPIYRQYLTPKEFTQPFGPTKAD
jgi:kumamolisin